MHLHHALIGMLTGGMLMATSSIADAAEVIGPKPFGKTAGRHARGDLDAEKQERRDRQVHDARSHPHRVASARQKRQARQRRARLRRRGRLSSPTRTSTSAAPPAGSPTASPRAVSRSTARNTSSPSTMAPTTCTAASSTASIRWCGKPRTASEVCAGPAAALRLRQPRRRRRLSRQPDGRRHLTP